MTPSDLVPRVSVWFERGGTYLLGDMEVRLLEAIERAGSIKEAAKVAGVSYRTAWARIRHLEHALGNAARAQPLLHEQRRERSDLARLEDHRVPGHERGDAVT